ncbi:isochorismatase family protein [Desulforhopalus singaporensis]|uniref:nicotinamidase n=1 Tax=Desulforhopalus singaporensis TaxID=91360 RepID=A0A1H0NZA3_9BACT|nr:isochorismatase family protein [Desulforhopalus singaporensis]SDO98001.1 nicotinamidase/pyrazinamidase [Desulforhopalus singaporensis]
METRGQQKSTGVIVVDVQGDFTEWKNGALAVSGTGKAFIDKLGQATSTLKSSGCKIYATMDWHPSGHISFFTSHNNKKIMDVIRVDGRTQVLWPPHCVQHSSGAELVLDKGLFDAVVKKGQNKNFDSYSGFKDDGGESTELLDILKKDGIEQLIVYGIAMDYCVRATAIDGVYAGFDVTVIEDLTALITPETSLKAKQDMINSGVVFQKQL